jgi:hypothetical protein
MGKDFDLNGRLLAFGYTDLKTTRGKVCGLHLFLFTLDGKSVDLLN